MYYVATSSVNEQDVIWSDHCVDFYRSGHGRAADAGY